MALKTIFQKLNELNVPFAVLKTAARLKNTSQQVSSEYHIIISVKDCKKLKGLNFSQSNYNSKVSERILSQTEQNTFFILMKEKCFYLFLSNNDGKVYEQTNNSFLNYYKANTK